MRFVAISDTHMAQPELPDGDVLIHAGDLTFTGSLIEISKAALWLHDQKQKKNYKHVIVIAGNHDRLFQKESPLARQIMTSRELIYLEDSGLTLAGSDALLGEISPGPERRCSSIKFSVSSFQLVVDTSHLTVYKVVNVCYN